MGYPIQKTIMEIHLFVAGQQVGPFSETQVRQYLGEGRVLISDLGCRDGLDNWQPLDQLLASLPLNDALSAPDVSPAESPGTENPTAPVKETSNTMQNDSLEPEEAEAATPAPESAAPRTEGQKTKRKLNKIVIQPILPLEPSVPTTRRKPRTGKTALTLGPLRPTTALPPVSGHLPRVKKQGKNIIRTGQLSLGEISEKALINSAAIAPGAPVRTAPVPTVPALAEVGAPAAAAKMEITPELPEAAPLPEVPEESVVTPPIMP
ncbi:MAG TPA: GYF domain-containing protein, partial [Candidatus Methylacidiphilales bacterium]